MPSHPWEEVRNAQIATARELEYDAGVVAQVWAAVGLISRTVDTSEGEFNTKLPAQACCDSSTSTVPNHHTIQAAIDSADTGDLIYIYPDTYNENITIPTEKPDLTLVGQNRNVTILNGTVTVNASGLTMVGFTINGPDSASGITVNEDDVSICDCRVDSCDTGIAVISGYRCRIMGNVISRCSDADVLLSQTFDCKIYDNELLDKGIKYTASGGGNEITGNLFDKVTGHGIDLNLSGGASPSFSNNFLRNISQNSINGVANFLTLYNNVWTSPSGVSINLDTGYMSGSFYGNNFSGPSYSFTLNSNVKWHDMNNKGNFWSNYTGQDTDADSVGECFGSKESGQVNSIN